MPERLLFVFAKEPRPGHVKTRMSPPLTPEQAARCQRAFLFDLINRLDGTADSRTVLWAAPFHDAPELARAAAGFALELAWQGDGDLGARMARALETAVVRGAVAVLVGADSPDLPRALVEEAFEVLCGPEGPPVMPGPAGPPVVPGRAGPPVVPGGVGLPAPARAVLVLGPSYDGGYYLVGCRGAVPPVFDASIGWGSDAVFARTLERARAAGVPTHVLAPWWDVDGFDDLRALAARADAGAAASLPECRRLLVELEAEGVAL